MALASHVQLLLTHVCGRSDFEFVATNRALCCGWQLGKEILKGKKKRQSRVIAGKLSTAVTAPANNALAGGCANLPAKRLSKSAVPVHAKKSGELQSIRSEQQDGISTDLTEKALSRRRVLQTALILCSSTTFLASQKDCKVLAVEDFTVTRKVFFDIAIDGQPIGEVVVGLYGADVPIGARRFAELAVGQRGIGYRRKEFVKVTPTYIQNNGVRSFSLSGGAADAANITGGQTNEYLAEEMAKLDKKGSRPKNVAGAVSLFVVDPTKPPPKTKLVAKNGKFVVLEEESRPDPNGTEFMIVTADAPELDASNLVVGHVVDGYDVVKRIAEVRVVNENSSSPYFQTAKLIGDTRAVVAERGFYRPYSKIVVTKSGELR